MSTHQPYQQRHPEHGTQLNIKRLFTNSGPGRFLLLALSLASSCLVRHPCAVKYTYWLDHSWTDRQCVQETIPCSPLSIPLKLSAAFVGLSDCDPWQTNVCQSSRLLAMILYPSADSLGRTVFMRGNENPITTAMCMSPIARPSLLFRYKKWLVFVCFEHIWRISPITSGFDSLRSTLHLLVLVFWPAFVIRAPSRHSPPALRALENAVNNEK